MLSGISVLCEWNELLWVKYFLRGSYDCPFEMIDTILMKKINMSFHFPLLFFASELLVVWERHCTMQQLLRRQGNWPCLWGTFRLATKTDQNPAPLHPLLYRMESQKLSIWRKPSVCRMVWTVLKQIKNKDIWTAIFSQEGLHFGLYCNVQKSTTFTLTMTGWIKW